MVNLDCSHTFFAHVDSLIIVISSSFIFDPSDFGWDVVAESRGLDLLGKANIDLNARQVNSSTPERLYYVNQCNIMRILSSMHTFDC